MKRFKSMALMLASAVLTLSAGVPERSLSHAIKHVTQGSRLRTETPTLSAPAGAPENTQDVPFVHRLGKNDPETKLYSLTDADNDGKTWKIGGFTAYSVCMKPTDSSIERNNDWLWSPPVYLEAGKQYRVTLDVGRALTSGKQEELEIMLGSEPTPEAMTSVAMPRFTFTNKAFETVDSDFSVSVTGYYYFGIHCVSERTLSGNMSVANFGVKIAMPKLDPAAAGELVVTPGEKGSLKAKCEYKAPVADNKGVAFTDSMSVKVVTNSRETHTFESVAPGEVVEFETNLANHGNNAVEVTAYRGETPGVPVRVSGIWAGPDSPLPPANVKAILGDDYKTVTISWDAVSEVGEHGGWVNTAGVTYYVFDAFGSIYDPAVAETEATSVTIKYDDIEGQDFVAYQITAGTVDYQYSLDASTDVLSIGQPDRLPFSESFADGSQQQQWCIEPASSSAVQIMMVKDNEIQTNIDDEDAEPVYLNSQDGDNGFIVILPTEPGAALGFFSNKFDIKGYERPVFDFYYQGQGSVLEALVGVNGETLKAMKTINLRETPTGAPGDWTHCVVELSDLAKSDDTRFIQVGLRVSGIHNTETQTWSVPVDNISVRNYVAHDMAVTSVGVPASVAAGDTATVLVKVSNNGYEAAKGATLVVSRDNETVCVEDIPEMAASATIVLPCEISTDIFDPETFELKISVVWAADADKSNNEAVATLTLVHSELPSPVALAALTSDGKVTLTWERPDFEAMTASRQIAEDFENPEYEAFTTQGFGGWQFVDVDGGKTYTFLDDVKNPFRTQPMAFQLYTPSLAGIPDRYMADIPPHSGNSLLVAFSTNGLNDNWLISPMLSGEAQTVSFWGRGFSVAFSEDFEIYYSTTGTALTDFVRVNDVKGYDSTKAVPEVWTEYSFQIPEGAKYFALRHVAYDSYALYLDDFAFSAAGRFPADLALTGYKVYRDKTEVAATNGETFVDTPQTDGNYSYAVQAVYNHGLSRPSQTVSVELTTGVSDISADEAGSVEFFNLQGIKVDNPVPGSTVIRRQGSKAEKVLVK